MRKSLKVLASTMATLLFGSTVTLTAFANPSCVLMRFTDDTRYDRVESAATLSDLVMEKLLNSGKFNFKETKVIDKNLEKLLYDEKAAVFQNARYAMNYGDYNTLFEGQGFNEKWAQSIASARLGQIVSPVIVSSIGRQHNAEYLIQGTILNLGSGDWMENKIADAAQYANTAMSMMGGSGAANMMGPLGPLSSLASSINVKKTGIGVQAVLKVIKVSTGEVIWQKEVIGKDTQKQISLLGSIKIGSDKLNNDMYYKAMENTAQSIADALIADSDAGKMFVK
ncbi:hypothetical protein [Phascolarctobacterium succinatutens]|uniref:hypothetical protein n=1 Tax=Phascolarctobacterium succinatutens TaxID=626940 RepID=UPI0026F05A8F|nr:hypothetical protein [Phascolarctobacterium succinatutens]